MDSAKTQLTTLLCALLILPALAGQSIAQSGRRRAPVSSGESAAAPPPAPVMVPETTVVTSQEQVGDISRFVLRNGMSVIINEMHAQPMASVIAYIKLGQLDRGELETARVVEYALPEMTDQNSRGDLARRIAKLGGLPNSTTEGDHTQFAITVPSSGVYDAISLQAGMIQHPKLDGDQVSEAIQRAIIYRGERCGNPSISGSDLAAAAFAGHQSGVDAPAGSITQDGVAAFYAAHYRPENVVIAVAGDAPVFETLVQIERAYGQFGVSSSAGSGAPKEVPAPAPSEAGQPGGTAPAPASVPAAAAAAPAQTTTATEERGFRYSQNKSEIGQAIITAAWRAPGFQSDDWPAVYVLSALLGRGRGSTLNQTLVLTQGLAGQVESTYRIFEKYGVIAVQVHLNSALVDKAEGALFKQIADVASNGPKAEDLTRAVAYAEWMFERSVSECLDRGTMLAAHEAAGGPALLPIDYIDRIRAVTLQDIKRVAQQYLAIEDLSVNELEPRSVSPRGMDTQGMRQLIAGWAPVLAGPAPKALPALHPIKPQSVPAAANQKGNLAFGPPPLKPEEQQEVDSESVEPLPVKDFSTLNGPQAFVREDHSSPVVTIAILFQGGRLQEDLTNGGITALMLRSLEYGTPRLSGGEIASDLEKLGADVELVNNPDFFGVTISVLSANAGAAMKLARTMIEEPAFRDTDIEKARMEQLSAISLASDADLEQSRQLLFGAVFSGYAYSFPTDGLEDVIAKLKPDQLREWYAHTIKTQYPLIAIVGDTEGSALVSEGVAGQYSRRDLTKTIQAKVPRYGPVAERAESRTCPVSITTLGLPGPKPESDEVPVLDVIAALLTTEGGSLPSGSDSLPGAPAELRAWTQPMMTGGVFCIRVVTAAQDEARARSEFLQFVQKLASKGLAEQESLSARAVAAEAFALKMLDQRERAVAYGGAVFTKHEATYIDLYPDRLSKVRSVDVAKALAAYFKASAMYSGAVRGVASPATPAPPKTAPAAPAPN
ncbi:MAG TPA: insulinase family protein [Blastocatellia bacterium]